MARLVQEIPVDLPHPALPAGEWADAYCVSTQRPFMTAREAAEAVFSDFPSWVDGLMALRNVIVAPLRLKTGATSKPSVPRIGFFPVVSEDKTRVVVGMNDRHLDFRCVVDLACNECDRDVTITTVIHRHNFLGRAYLKAVLPFHRLILRTSLAALAKA